MSTEKKYQRPGGRKPKADPCRHRLTCNLNDADYARFLSLFDESGLKDKAHFITSCIFNRELKVVKIDKDYMRLTSFHSQFRAIGVNYNQLTKSVKATFTEKKALVFLYKLENATKELVAIYKKVIALTDEFEAKHLNSKL